MKLFRIVKPPEAWRTPVAVMLGVFAGLMLYTFYISNAVSYVSNNPKTCINCHIMKPQFATWQHSSHREQAVCNDCHVPQNNFVNTYYFKAKDGLRHATIFTLRNEPQVIFIKEEGKAAVQMNCIRCHRHLNAEIENRISLEAHYQGEGKLCWECHREVPHGRVNSLASVSYFLELKTQRIPAWLQETLSE